MLVLCLSLYAAAPAVSVVYSNEQLDFRNEDQDVLLLSFEIDNPNEIDFTLELKFENNCAFKKKRGKTTFSLSSIKWRENGNSELIEIWDLPQICEHISFPINFTDKKSFYSLELLGSWGKGGDKLTAGAYKETVSFTISVP
ncbi:MAG: hypothetical protein LBC85_03050 [Fibromonadaceae bacterium]|nr:hypothetical protein [Fibromonadaceae bacterium]